MHKKITIFFIILILIIVAGFLTFRYLAAPKAQLLNDDSQEHPTNTTTEIPPFSYFDYDGNTVSLRGFTGKPLVLNSWASWCPFCINELPDFAKVKKELGDSVNIVAINRKESLTVAKKFTDDINVSGDLIFLIDESDSFYRTIEGFAMPETLFIDSNGKIIEHYRGKLDEDLFRQKLQKIL